MDPYEPLCELCANAIELVRSVRSFTDQHEAAVTCPLQQRFQLSAGSQWNRVASEISRNPQTGWHDSRVS